MEEFSGKSCREFAGLLASKTPVPGGGGAAALTGALGIALCSMVANYTVGKPKYAASEPDVVAIRDRAEGIRNRLLDLIDEDARAFLVLSGAYAMPRTDAARPGKVEDATLRACDAPLGMIAACGESLELLSEILAKGSRMLVSDTGCGAALCKAAMDCAAMNVYVNTKALQDRAAAARIDAAVAAQIGKYGPIADRIVRSVRERLGK